MKKLNVGFSYILIVLMLGFLTGCGLISYHTEVFKDGKKVGEIKSNVPAKIKSGDLEIDQRNESIYEKIGNMIPKDVNIEK